MGFREDVIHISVRRENFRVTFLHPFLVVFCSALLVCECFFLLIGHSGSQVAFVIIPGIVLLLCVAAVVILQMRFQVGMGPEGIRCYDFWCRPLQTDWEQIRDVRVVRTAGLEYLQVLLMGNSRSIWIPLFVYRSRLLKSLMLTYTRHSCELQQKLAHLRDG